MQQVYLPLILGLVLPVFPSINILLTTTKNLSLLQRMVRIRLSLVLCDCSLLLLASTEVHPLVLTQTILRFKLPTTWPQDEKSYSGGKLQRLENKNNS